MGDIRPPIAAALRAFGLDAVLTAPGGDEVEVRVMWTPPRANEVPAGSHRRVETLRTLVIPLSSDVPEVPRDTEVTVAEVSGGTSLDWRVDAIVHHDSEHVRALMVPA